MFVLVFADFSCWYTYVLWLSSAVALNVTIKIMFFICCIGPEHSRNIVVYSSPEYDEENPCSVTKCEHHFHLCCILEWMERKDTCPVCDQVSTEISMGSNILVLIYKHGWVFPLVVMKMHSFFWKVICSSCLITNLVKSRKMRAFPLLSFTVYTWRFILSFDKVIRSSSLI